MNSTGHKPKPLEQSMAIENLVIVRTYSAGVHVGVLQSQDGTVVKLTNAARIWRWRGANTLNEMALHGCSDDWTRISESVPEITLTEAIEIIAVSPDAQANLLRSRWG